MTDYERARYKERVRFPLDSRLEGLKRLQQPVPTAPSWWQRIHAALRTLAFLREA